MYAIVYKCSKKAVFYFTMLFFIAISMTIFFSVPVQQVASLQAPEAEVRRAVNPEEVLWHWEKVGFLNALIFLQIPMWLTVGVFFLGSETIRDRKLGNIAIIWRSFCCILFVVGGTVLFLLTPQINPMIWGLSILRFTPLVMSAFPAGQLASGTNRDVRWLALLPTSTGFLILLVYIASCTNCV